MKRRLLILFLALFLIFSLTSIALAQSYSFSLEKEVVNVYWNDDGSMSLDYVFTFNNNPSAHAIDYVDVGLPNGSFRTSSIYADVNGNAVSVSEGDYEGNGTGVAVVLGNNAIPAGGRGKVHIYIGYIDRVLRLDDNDENYASAVFGTTWFGSEYVSGSTDLTVTMHLPPGVQPQEPRYHIPEDWVGADEPEIRLDNDGRVSYTWHSPNANGYTQYTFGASFPKSYVPENMIVHPSFFERMGLSGDDIEGILILLCFGGFFFGLPAWSTLQNRKRKMKYMSPKIAIEGHGIKRGLTAVESAVLMQTPLDKVMTMILFGVVKKGAAEVTSRDPVKLKVADPLPPKLHPYEKEFLAAFADGKNNRKEQRRKLQKVTVDLIKSLETKMKGFSRIETIAYYKSIMERAWKQIEAAGTPEMKSQMYDEALEWTMLDRNYEERTQDVFRRGPVFVPMWWNRYDPEFRRGSVKTASARPATSSGKSLASSMPQLPGADFAASVVGGAQTFSQKVIGNLNKFTGNVTNVTNPPPPSSSGGGGGGGGCACACACAGCACACAGGGR